MDAYILGQVGPQLAQDGTNPIARMGRTGDLVVTEAHGKYYEASYRGGIYFATMSAGVIFPAPAATANNPMTLANPAGSPFNLVLISFDMIMTVIPGTPVTGLYGLYVNTNPAAAAVTGTSITPLPGNVGSAKKPTGQAFSTSTVPAAPTLLMPFGNKITGEVAAVVPITGLPAYHLEFDGKIIIPPGCAITPQMTAADTTNATVLCSFCWEEVPV